MQTMQVTSSAFIEGGMIPARYTADGQDISPPLQFSDIPTQTKSLAIISDDPDAPMGTWVHWVVWNLPPQKDIPENMPPIPQSPDGIRQGTTDFGKIGWGGPAPPSGTHRYYFRVYALDCTLELKAGARRFDVEKAMKGHILAEGCLMGKYKRMR
jgi:Raf kinase inhibitor-like YbhB/YbcL family protein